MGILFQYSFLVGLILLIEVVGAILGVVYRNKIEAELQKQLTYSLNTYYMGLPDGYNAKASPEGVISLTWDYAQVLVSSRVSTPIF